MKKILLFLFTLFICGIVAAQENNATVIVDSSTPYQKITGFGGFVCNGQFQYGWMTTDEIKKLWGKDSEAGYNIMRLYIPSGESSFSQTLSAAQMAKSLGIILFASPWSMPAAWKTHNTTNSQYKDNNGVVQKNYLQEAHYVDYANYLNDYVSYLRKNGVELDAISIQNEPDAEVDYAGCYWTPTQLNSFIAKYGNLISCKIIAPESMGMTNTYATPLLADSVIDNFSIYAGHQYQAIQNGFQQLQAKGKEAWMTEYLSNWNDTEPVARNFNWQKDAFIFAEAVNNALLANVNAWIHYASKRFYGMMGDNSYGTVTGAITKRGYILSHYAKYTTGSTRIKASWIDNSKMLQGSSFISQTGDSIIVMVINPSNYTYSLTVSLPFNTKAGESIVTTSSADMSASSITLDKETSSPVVDINASSMTTLIFTNCNITSIPLIVIEKEKENTLYDLMGNRVYHPQKKVVYIYKDGRKVIFI